MTIIDEQQEIAKQINQDFASYKTDKHDIKNVTYTEDRIKCLEEHWSKFSENNATIIEIAKYRHSTYIKENFAHQVEKIVNEYRDRLYNRLNFLNNQSEAINNSLLNKSNGHNESHASSSNHSRGPSSGNQGVLAFDPTQKMDILTRKIEIKQACLKNQITKIEESIDIADAAYLTQKTKQLEQTWSDIMTIDNDIMSIDYTPAHKEVMEGLRDEFDDMMIKINKKMTGKKHEVKVPNIKLPHFSGDYRAWLSIPDSN